MPKEVLMMIQHSVLNRIGAVVCLSVCANSSHHTRTHARGGCSTTEMRLVVLYVLFSGGRQVNRSEAFICGPALSELGVALDLSKVSELVVAPSAADLIPDSTTAEPREAGCFCIALTEVGTLQDTHRGDRGVEDKDDGLAEAMVERAMALCGEAAERDLREDASDATSFVHKLQTGSFTSLFRGSGGSDRQRRQSHLLDGSPDLCGLEVLSAYVPKFVWQRCLDHVGFETIAENRRVSILFIISSFQVTATGIPLAAAWRPSPPLSSPLPSIPPPAVLLLLSSPLLSSPLLSSPLLSSPLLSSPLLSSPLLSSSSPLLSSLWLFDICCCCRGCRAPVGIRRKCWPFKQAWGR